MVRSTNKEAWKLLTESNGTPAIDLGHMNVVLKQCICIFEVDLGIVDINVEVMYMYVDSG